MCLYLFRHSYKAKKRKQIDLEVIGKVYDNLKDLAFLICSQFCQNKPILKVILFFMILSNP